MGLNIPASRPGIEQMLYSLSARMNATVTAGEIPSIVHDIKVHGDSIAEFVVQIDFSNAKTLEESIDGLRQLANVMSCARPRK